MRLQIYLALCAVMAFVLAGCGSEIVESAVTETQVIDVNEPSAVEQAVQNTGYDFEESAVTEMQVIDANEPSAVEQAVQNTDYDFEESAVTEMQVIDANEPSTVGTSGTEYGLGGNAK